MVKKQQYEDYFLTVRGLFLYITMSGVKEGLASLFNKKIEDITMKKIVLSIAGVMAAAAFAPDASAVPVFARQTGMACSACHFQHFPLLNAFGRAFKEGGFTMMGAEPKVEGDNLSIPAYLNVAVLTSMGYIKTNQTADTSGVTKNYGNGVWGVPGMSGGGGDGEASLFVGGHVSDFAGFLSEITLGGAGVALDSAKLPMLYDMGTAKIGVVPFATNAQGASYSMEVANTGANAVHSITNTVGPTGEFINAVSAQQYINTAGNATGLGFVANSDMGLINITKYQQTGIATGGYASLGSTYARVLGTFTVGDWDTAIGAQNWSGASLAGNLNGAGVPAALAAQSGTIASNAVGTEMRATKAWAVDGQMQGSLGGMPVGFYASYARAPAVMAGGVNINTFQDANGGGANATLTRSSFNVDAELGVVPEVATIGAAIRRGKSGIADAARNNLSDNAFYLTATYKLQQNMLARLSWVKQSGGYWDNQNINGGGTNAQVMGTQTTELNMYVLF